MTLLRKANDALRGQIRASDPDLMHIGGYCIEAVVMDIAWSWLPRWLFWEVVAALSIYVLFRFARSRRAKLKVRRNG